MPSKEGKKPKKIKKGIILNMPLMLKIIKREKKTKGIISGTLKKKF